MNKMKTVYDLLRRQVGLLAALVVLFGVHTTLFAQTAEIREMSVHNPTPIDGDADILEYEDVSYVTEPFPSSSANNNDPWVSSALIEFDQPYLSATALGRTDQYPSDRLRLCMKVVCDNKPLGGSTYSIAFPLQNVRFDIVKFYNNKNVQNPDETPAIRSLEIYPHENDARCGSYKCPGGATSGATCNAAKYYTKGIDCKEGWDKDDGQCKNSSNPAKEECFLLSTGETADGCSCAGGVCDFVIFNDDGTMSGEKHPLEFCTEWDGKYEINGEFGATNGQYAFRGIVATDKPGDNIITDKIEFNSQSVYPATKYFKDVEFIDFDKKVYVSSTFIPQIPIQVDVTNVHAVRSTPSVVGNITPVAAEPYTFVYRLSKDADVSVNIYDAATKDTDSYKTDNGTTDDGYLRPAGTTPPTPALVRVLSDWEPHDGEGMNGAEKDTTLTTFDSWDGRNQDGLLLPAGNYLVSIQAKSQDEWGTDFSRAVTRQMSIDPLRLTDVVSTGLNKKATAYASISYVPTEAANVYWNIYTPGTVFTRNLFGTGIHVDSSTRTGTPPTIQEGSGTLVYSSVEARTSRMAFTSKWDGLCGVESGCERTYSSGEKMPDGGFCDDPSHSATSGVCKETFAYGAPMPDGNYVYALWAEIPYNGYYRNVSSTDATRRNQLTTTPCEGVSDNREKLDGDKYCFTGVKTQKYTTGQIAIERGMVDITIQPVGYATVGSSPTAYGLDPFIFKYSIVRDANVIAKVTNTAGVTVKHLTPEEGITQVSQQMNTISWDGMDDTGRMVTPGTYMFVVETHDAMFPAVKNKASAVFPVDMYRVVDLSTTDVYGDSDAKATISYSLSKPMNVQVNIYNKDVVIPDYNSILNGDYSGFQVTSTATGVTTTNSLAGGSIVVGGTTITYPTLTAPTAGDLYAKQQTYGTDVRYTWTVMENPQYDVTASTVPGKERYRVSVLQENIVSTSGVDEAAWPPKVCTTDGNSTVFTSGYVDPAKVNNKNACIYVNDTTFTNYPTKAQLAQGNVDVRLQPVKTFERSSLKTGNGITIMEEWDALYFYNPASTQCKGSTVLSSCAYEMVPDGQYPFYISARANEAFNRYYAHSNDTIAGTTDKKYLEGAPFKTAGEVQQQDFLYATEKPVGKINVTRGAVYFLDGSTIVYPNIAQLFNASSNTIFIPPYEINFSVSRASTVEVAIVALADNVCNPVEGVSKDLKNNKAGDVCKYLSTMTINNIGSFDANTVRKMYWDGRDNNGYYVKSGVYEVRLIARNYPNPDLYEPTVKSITLNANIMQVFDLLEADGYAISQRNTNMDIRYQISVPMKVAIQFFKPGTTIYDYQKGTLRNPTTGKEVKDIREVLVRSIVGIRPATTLINEQWDGLDYAQQEVPDGTYPFRFVTATESANIDTITGEIVAAGADDTSTNPRDWKINYVADTNEYTKLHNATIAIGDGTMVCSDWEKTVFFYPNPLKASAKGTLEITKMPAPGKVSIKFFNLAGDLVRDSNYSCVDANNYMVTMGKSLEFSPDNTPNNSVKMTDADLQAFGNVRNAALRCRWDRTNQHGKKVARGVYFGLVDFKATSGRQHCQKVVKVLIP